MYAYYAITGMIQRDHTNKVSTRNKHVKEAPSASTAAAGSNPSSSFKGRRSFIDRVKAAAAVTITPLQILQMIIGSYAIVHTHSVCPNEEGPVFTAFGGAMYLSYLALFLHMFSGKIKKFFGGKDSTPKRSSSETLAKKAS
jgi:hypothetical protein